MRKAALHNLGCKVNAYETDAMQQMLMEAGYEIVPFEEAADVYIINTCTVTNMADRKSRQMLHRAKKKNPESIVVAAGCYVQAAGEALYEDGSIDLVIGNNRKKDLVELLEGIFEGRKEAAILDINHTKEYESLTLSRAGEHTRAYVKVQDGCNQFCSYCIIPYVRGRVRSREKADVLAEVRRLAGHGYQEVVLTGIHLSSYGVDLDGENLESLILAVHEIEGIERIRLGSLEPGIITEDFVKTISGLPKMCPHFHLSLQSGCNTTLKRMNRRYTAEEFLDRCKLLRTYFENPALTTDVIVGFPGETEEEFKETEAFLQEVCFYETHLFKYSRRKGTRADRMENQIPEPEKTKRSNCLQTLHERNKAAYQAGFIGRDLEVLFEEAVVENGVTYQIGHTKEYLQIMLPCEEDLSNRICVVKAVSVMESGAILGEKQA